MPRLDVPVKFVFYDTNLSTGSIIVASHYVLAASIRGNFYQIVFQCRLLKLLFEDVV
jgi:hypothetical protein